MSEARRRFRFRRWARRAFFAATAVALGGAMISAADRGSEARSLSDEIDRLEQREAVARGRVAAAMRRVDSLSSRDRIARAASRLGLRPASDEEITFVRVERPREDERSGSR